MTTDESIITGSPAAEGAVGDDVSPPENDATGAAANGKNKENQGEKEQPIEELYDLSKPIKRVRFLMQGCILDIIITCSFRILCSNPH
jgi:hypothetical protein